MPNQWYDRQPGGYEAQNTGGGTGVQPGIDKLNGILIGGLLGRGPNSLILGGFNLGWFGVSGEISELPGSRGYHNFPPYRQPREEKEDDKYLTVKVVLKGNEYSRVYRISNDQANIFIRINEKVKNFATKTKVFVDKFVVRPIKKVLKINIDNISNK
jgi:hypothetical protein